jgi:hypothetical protein
MAKDKSSVILYTDLIHTFEHLTDAQAGRLVKHLFRYVNDQNPIPPDKVTTIAFEPIKQQLKRDLKKWEKYINKQSDNGKKGGRPKKPKETQKSQAFFKKPKKADSVNVSVSDTVISRERESKGIFPDENFEIEISEMDVGRAVEYLSLTKNIKATPQIVNAIWEAFKTKYFTGQNFYKDDRDIVRHFFETLKFEKINGTQTNRGSNEPKLGTSEARIAALKKW